MKLKFPRFRLPRLSLPRARFPTSAQIESLLRPLCLAAGLFMLGRGLWLIYPPAMWLVVGLILIWAGIPTGQRR